MLTMYAMQVKCDECESWYHQRCVNLRKDKHHDIKYYETANFVGACCSNNREFKLDSD